MKICIAQTKPIRGDIEGNIADHRKLITRAVKARADLLVFPELSLTGYEPTLAKDLAVAEDDTRFDQFQTLSDANSITIGVGAPTRSARGICISMLLFQPRTKRSIYSKSFLHADEKPFFMPGQNSPHLRVRDTDIALAICYEISVPEHLEFSLKHRPHVYLASVAKFMKGINNAMERLSTIAKETSIPVLMSNCVGFSDGSQCAGHSSVWNDRGLLVGELNDSDEGLLIFDTQSQKASEL